MPSLVKTTSRVQWPPPRELGVAGDVGDDGLGGAGGVEVAGLVGEALDGGGVADVDVLRIVGGIEGDAEGMVESGGEGLRSVSALPSAPTPRRTIRSAGAGVGEEEIAVGRGADQAGHR